MRPADERDIRGRLAALEDYVEYLRQQGEAGMDHVRRAQESDAAPRQKPGGGV